MKSDIEKVKDLPRMQVGEFNFDGYSIYYMDSLSFYYEYIDIFKNKVYHFTADNSEPNIIDAGGCIGMATLYFKKIYPKAKITVFEPDPEVYRVLMKNIRSNSVSGVNIFNAGVGKKEGRIAFYPDGADGGAMFQMKESIGGAIYVNIARLSNYMDDTIDLLKLNIEGMEGEVFEEIQHKLCNVKKIILEYHAFANLTQNLHKILEILDKQGFRYIVSNVPSAIIPIPFSFQKDYKYFNLVYAENMSYTNKRLEKDQEF